VIGSTCYLRVLFLVFLLAGAMNKMIAEVPPPDTINGRHIDIVFVSRIKNEETIRALHDVLAHFKELKGKKIVVRRRKINTMMAARPTWSLLWRNKENRNYVLVLTAKKSLKPGSVLGSISYKAKTGILAHEFSHFKDYSERNAVDMVFFGVSYFFSREKKERATDQIAIEKGLGRELLQYNVEIENNVYAEPKYLERRKKYYLSKKEICNKLDIEYLHNKHQ
jgi:hypothetical protein